MESSSPLAPFPLLRTPVESNYRACTSPYRFSSDYLRKATAVEIQWIDLFLNSVPSLRQWAENDTKVANVPAKAEKFAQSVAILLILRSSPTELHTTICCPPFAAFKLQISCQNSVDEQCDANIGVGLFTYAKKLSCEICGRRA